MTLNASALIAPKLVPRAAKGIHAAMTSRLRTSANNEEQEIQAHNPEYPRPRHPRQLRIGHCASAIGNSNIESPKGNIISPKAPVLRRDVASLARPSIMATVANNGRCQTYCSRCRRTIPSAKSDSSRPEAAE